MKSLALAALLGHAAFAAPSHAAAVTPLEDICDACEWGVRSVEDFIADPHHQDVLEHAVDTVVCAAGDDKRKREHCRSYVRTAIRRAVEFVEDYTNPQELCKPVCPSSALAAMRSTPRGGAGMAELKDWRCPFCEFVAAQADKALQNATTDEEVLRFLRTTCRDLPQQFAGRCVEYVNTRGLLLIALLETMPPKRVCEVAGACADGPLHEALQATAPSGSLKADVAKLLGDLGSVQRAQTCTAPALGVRAQLDVEELGNEEAPPPKPSEACEICKVAVAEAREKVADPQFQSEVEHYLYKLCKQAGNYEEFCQDSVQQYAPLVFAAALDYLRPVYLCVDLTHVCPQPDAGAGL